MTKEGPKLLWEIVEERHVLGELVSWEERAIRHPPQPSLSSLNEGTSVGGQLWEHGENAIVKELVTSALNARSWQSGRINEGMTPEQCHAVHCNSQQVKGSVGWDRYSSGDLHNRQMDGQDEGSRRIYNQRDLTKRGRAIRKTPESSSCVVSGEEKKNSSSDKARGRTLTPSPNYTVDDPTPQRSCSTVDEVLTKAQFLRPLLYQIHCIGHVGFGFAHIYSKRHPPNRDPTIFIIILTIYIFFMYIVK